MTRLSNWLVAAVSATALLLPAASQAGKADGTLVWATEQEAPVVDPYYTQNRVVVILWYEVCDSLLHRDPKTGEYGPHLAKSYKWIDDKTLELELRDDVVFHGGEKFSAEDVKYTFDHVTAPDSGAVTPSNSNWVKSTEVVNPSTVRFHLHKPFPVALEYLSGLTPILAKGHYDKAPERQGKKDYGALKPNCTGPYKIVDVKPGQSIDFEAHDKYFGGAKGKPTIKKVRYRTIADRETQLAELLTGGVDWIWDLRNEKAKELKAMDVVQVVESPILRFSYLAFDASGKGGPNPFQDIRLRKAVAHAVNAKAIAKNLVGEAAEVIASACHPAQFGCFTDVAKYEYDPEKAKKLLAEAGHANGLSVDIFSFREREWTEAVINDLRQVGIKANLRFMQYNALRPMLRSGEANFAHLSWGSFSINDVSASTSYFFGGGADDLARDQQVQEWLKIADSSVDPEKRKEFYKKALIRIAEQAYWAPLFTMTKWYAFSKDLDTRPWFDDLPRFYQAKWK